MIHSKTLHGVTNIECKRVARKVQVYCWNSSHATVKGYCILMSRGHNPTKKFYDKILPTFKITESSEHVKVPPKKRNSILIALLFRPLYHAEYNRHISGRESWQPSATHSSTFLTTQNISKYPLDTNSTELWFSIFPLE